jgi:replication initiation protein RepC
MTMESALEASGTRFAGSPTGFRRLTPGLLKVDHTAEAFAGLPDQVTNHGQLLAAFKAAAPWLGLSPRLVHAVDWLFKFTMPQDWGRGGRPIVWPSASLQQDGLGLSETQVKTINRALIEAGLLTMKDSPNGKRYGRRDGRGQIVEAYGFDLSPIAIRHAEFARLAAEAKAERSAMQRLRRRATIARNGITQILDTVAEYGFAGDEWVTLRRETRDIAQALRKVERSEEMALGVASLERRQNEARERLESLLATLTPAPSPTSEVVDSDPLGPENRPHQYSYKPNLYPEQDTVIATEKGSSLGGQASERRSTPGRRQPTEKGSVLKLHPDELVRLAPRLGAYLPGSDPTWSELIDAAAMLRSELDVSKSLWGDACLTMGRQEATIAIAIVSTKDLAHFRTTPAGYFHGMVAKAKIGQLNLDRTIWGMRRARQPQGSVRPGNRGGGGGGPASRSHSWN